MDEDLKQHLQGMDDRTAALIASEPGPLHITIRDMDRRLRRVDGNTITTMELLTRQSRWHEQSDDAVHDFVTRQAEVERKLDDLRSRLEKLEKVS